MGKIRLWEIWQKAELGPICPIRKFEIEIYWKTLKRILKDYDIKYDPESLVPLDETLIRDTFEAGLELLIEVGVLCVDTERIIKIDESEVKEVLRSLPGKVALGEENKISAMNRKNEEKSPPIIFGGPSGAPVSEEMAVKIYQSYMQEPIIDAFFPGVIKNLEGIDVKAGSFMEIYAEACNLSWIREAQRRAGRKDIIIQGSPAVSHVADISGSSLDFGWKKVDYRDVWLLPHLKTDYSGLCRAMHFMLYGCPSISWGTGFIGGLAGGPEGAAVTTVAETMAATVLYNTALDYVGPINALYPGTSDRMTMWSNFLSNAAINTNTNHISIGEGPYITYAGPCTDMCFYEIAATTIGVVVVGSHPFGVAPCQGVRTDYCSGMESRFMGEVAHVAVNLNKNDANDIIKEILKKYESKIVCRNPPMGRKFQECYDTVSIVPSKEYIELYKTLRAELSDIGIEFDSSNI